MGTLASFRAEQSFLQATAAGHSVLVLARLAQVRPGLRRDAWVEALLKEHWTLAAALEPPLDCITREKGFRTLLEAAAHKARPESLQAVLACMTPEEHRHLAPEREAALRVTAQKGHLASLDALLAVGTDPTGQECEAFREAARRGHLPILERLLPLSDPTLKNGEALRWAAAQKRWAVVTRLAPLIPPCLNDTKPICRVARLGQVDLMRLLVPCYKHRDASGDTLVAAAQANQVAAVVACGELAFSGLSQATARLKEKKDWAALDVLGRGVPEARLDAWFEAHGTAALSGTISRLQQVHLRQAASALPPVPASRANRGPSHRA
jgi:hypothetical protein